MLTCLNACCIRFHLLLTPSQHEFTITVSGCESSCFTTHSLFIHPHHENEVTEMPAAGCVFSNFPPAGWFPWALAHSMPLCAHLRCQDPVVTLRISPQSPPKTTHAASPTMTNEFISISTPRSGSEKVNLVKRKTVWLKLVCYCVLLARAEG